MTTFAFLIIFPVAVLAVVLLAVAAVLIRDWRHRRRADRELRAKGFLLVLLSAIMAQGCATTYRPRVTGPEPFDFVLTPEQCLELKKERRTYRATEQTAGYMAGAGALVSVLALGFVDAKAVPVVASGVSLLAGGTLAFTGSQVESLDAELADGGCGR